MKRIVTNPDNLSAYKTYIQLEDITHSFFTQRDYLRLNLPVLSPSLVPESYLEIFKTEYSYITTQHHMYLTPSPEMFMKRILAYSRTNCYSLGKAFRNQESSSSLHSCEFTMLEYYCLGASYMDIADELLDYLRALNAGKNMLTYQGQSISLESWEKISVDEAFVKYAGLAPGAVFDEDAIMQAGRAKGYVVDGFSYEDVFTQIYVQDVEKRLGSYGKPTLIYDYPKAFAALAKLNDDGRSAQRFEFYIGGVELGDCYSELTNPDQQRARFEHEVALRKKNGLIDHATDWGFVEALEHGLPECAGIAIGFDRLAMIFCDLTSIHDLRLVDVV